MISVIQNELSYRYVPLRELMRELSEREDLKDLPFLTPWETEEELFTQHWEKSLKGFSVDKACDGHLLSFGSMLGTTELEGQLRLCRHYQALFEEALREAREKKEKYAKLYTSLGCMAGIAIVVLFV